MRASAVATNVDTAAKVRNAAAAEAMRLRVRNLMLGMGALVAIMAIAGIAVVGLCTGLVRLLKIALHQA